MLSRVTDPTEGRIVLRGRVGSLLEVGTGFHPELTGRENICLNGAILGMRRAEIARQFDEIVAFAEVEKFIDTPVKHYLSGMYLRLGVRRGGAPGAGSGHIAANIHDKKRCGVRGGGRRARGQVVRARAGGGTAEAAMEQRGSSGRGVCLIVPADIHFDVGPGIR